MGIQFIGQEDTLEEVIEMHSSILAWKITWTKEPGGLQSIGSQSYDQPRQHIKKQRHYFANKGPSSQTYGFSNSHVWM